MGKYYNWYATYTVYLQDINMSLIVEQDGFNWFFNVLSDKNAIFRSGAIYATPEQAQVAAQEWIENPPKGSPWPFDEPIEKALDVTTWEELPPQVHTSNPLLSPPKGDE